MKTEMKNDVLGFNKSSLVELNNQQLVAVDGGLWQSTVACLGAAAGVSSPGCIIVSAVVGFGAGFIIATLQD